VRAKGEKPLEELELEVMTIDQPLEMNLEDPDWWFPVLEWLVEGKLPPPTRRRLSASPAEQKRSSS
jgi:hypothetical protein